MTHLGTQISALADGRLTGAARERALCHVAACAPCADELAATRAARQTLASAGDVPPAPTLTPRLLALGAAGLCPTGDAGSPDRSAHPRGRGNQAGGPALGGGPVLGDGPFGSPALGAAPVTRRVPVRSVAVLTVGAVGVALFMLGDVHDVTPDSHPAADLALLAAAGSVDGGAVPVLASGAGVPDEGAGTDDAGVAAVWPGGELPEGYAVVATHAGASGAELALDGPAGPVVVLRQTGRLREEVVEDVPTLAIGDHDVHVLSDAPWHAVWQSGDSVVGVVAAHRSTAVEELVAEYPAVSVDGGLAARMSRGWQTVVGAWAP